MQLCALVLINCGGVPKLRDLLWPSGDDDENGGYNWALPPSAHVYVVDSHRPYHHSNFRGDRVTILDFDDAVDSDRVPFDGDSVYAEDDDDDEDDVRNEFNDDDAATAKVDDDDPENDGGGGDDDVGALSKRRRLRRAGDPDSAALGDSRSKRPRDSSDSDNDDGGGGSGGGRVIGPMDRLLRDSRLAKRRYKEYYVGQTYGRPASFVMYELAEQVWGYLW